jgi:hypothetical protein
MLFTSPVYSKASGSIAGLTYSHNKGGMYARSRVTPTDPASSRQNVVRVLFGTLAAYWTTTLTQAERDAWDLYGDNVAMTNRLGETIYLSGQQHFIRANTPRTQAGITVLETAPTNYNLGSYTAPTISSAQDDDSVSMGFTNTDAWCNATGGYMLYFGGLPQSAGRNFFKGPYRYMGKTTGSATPPTSPEALTSAYALGLGNKLWVMARCIQIDGRLSQPIHIGPHTVTSSA